MPAISRRNLVGRQTARLRHERGWSQEQMTAQCQIAGWDISREKLAKIESGTRGVADYELFELAKVLGVTVQTLFEKELQKHFKQGTRETRAKDW